MRVEDIHAAVVDYQVRRLRRTYADIHADPRTRAIGEFFFGRVYGTADKEERDDASKRLYGSARKYLGDEITANVGRLMRLNELTDRLDAELVDELAKMQIEEFTEEDYEDAYRRCDNYDERVEQIDLLITLVEYFFKLSRVPGIRVMLSLAKPYLALRRAMAVYRFLSDGYRSCKRVKDVGPFAAMGRKREMDRLNRIYNRRSPQAMARGKAR